MCIFGREKDRAIVGGRLLCTNGDNVWKIWYSLMNFNQLSMNCSLIYLDRGSGFNLSNGFGYLFVIAVVQDHPQALLGRNYIIIQSSVESLIP